MSRAGAAIIVAAIVVCLSVSRALAQSVTFVPAVFMGKTPTPTTTSTFVPTATGTPAPKPSPIATARPAVCACGGNYCNCAASPPGLQPRPATSTASRRSTTTCTDWTLTAMGSV